MGRGGNNARDGRGLNIGDPGIGPNSASGVVAPVVDQRSFSALVGVNSEVDHQGSVVFHTCKGTTKIADGSVLRRGDAA